MNYRVFVVRRTEEHMFSYPGGYDLIVNIVNVLWWNMSVSLCLSVALLISPRRVGIRHQPHTFLRWGNVIYSYHIHKQPLLGIELKTESQFTVMCTCKVSTMEYKSTVWTQQNVCTRFVLSPFPSKTAFIIPQLIAFGATWKWIGSIHCNFRALYTRNHSEIIVSFREV